MVAAVHLDLRPLKTEDIADPSSPAFTEFLDKHFDAGTKIAESMDSWPKQSSKINGTVEIVNLTTGSSTKEMRKHLGVEEYWCGRISRHMCDEFKATAGSRTESGPTRNPSQLFRADTSSGTVEGQKTMISQHPNGVYEMFRRGLLDNHSQNEREYIESCRETECLQIFQRHVAEVWRLTYELPAPTSPRTFVVLLLSRELDATDGRRRFMNISLPFSHPACIEKQGPEKSRVRGRYVSVEQVTESSNGDQVEWRMATSSDAGGNIPRFLTNSSLASSIAEDVPAFVKWVAQRFRDEGETATAQLNPVTQT